MRGFTLVEVLVVAAITVFITGLLVANFSRTRVDLNQTRLLVQDAIREAQSRALSGALYATSGSGPSASTYRCGYGVHFVVNGYIVYAGPDSAVADCSTQDRNYNAGSDDVVRQGYFSNSTLEIVLPVQDIFFEPPNPTTYIGGSSAAAPENINIHRIGAQCPSADCRTINVSTSGLITTQ